jgi:hypothetical protein
MSYIRVYSSNLSYNPEGRDVPSNIYEALNSPEIEIFFAIDLNFDSGDLNLWTGLGELDVNGVTYVGTGQLLSVSSVEETAEIAAKGAELSLSGIPSTLLSLALTEPYQGRVCKIYFGVMSDTTFLTEIFTGIMDRMDIQEGAETSTITLAVENKLVDLERTRAIRFTSAYQKSIYPGDKGFDFVEDLQDRKLIWGREVDA